MSIDGNIQLDDPYDDSVLNKSRAYLIAGFLFAMPFAGLLSGLICWWGARKLQNEVYWDDPGDIRDIVSAVITSSRLWVLMAVVVAGYMACLHHLQWPLANLMLIQPVIAAMIALLAAALWMLARIFMSHGDILFARCVATAACIVAGYLILGVVIMWIGSDVAVALGRSASILNLVVTIAACLIYNYGHVMNGYMKLLSLMGVLIYLTASILWLIATVMFPSVGIVPFMLYFTY